jgi:hypothetical protein
MQASAPKSYTFGRYIIRTFWRGRLLVYDVMTKGGMLVAAGFDMASGSEEKALEGITDRLYGKAKAA